MKDPILKQTEDLLSKFQTTCDKCQCILMNLSRQMYVLSVKKVSPSDLCVILESPGGRTRPLDPEAHWQATLRMEGAVAKMNVKQLTLKDGDITIHLHPEVVVFLPRSTVRLQTNSRSPVYVNFEGPEYSMEGQLSDFSMGGAGICLDFNPNLAGCDFVYKLKFHLRGVKFIIATARVAHVEKVQKKWHLGLAFDGVSSTHGAELQAIIDDFKERKLDYLVSAEVST